MASFSLCTRCILPQMPARLLETDPKTQVVRLINLSHVTADKTPPPTPSKYIYLVIFWHHITRSGTKKSGEGAQLKGHKFRGRRRELHKGPLAGVCVYAMWIMSFSASFYLAVRVCTRKPIRFDPIGSQKSAFHSLPLRWSRIFPPFGFLRRRRRSERENQFPFRSHKLAFPATFPLLKIASCHTLNLFVLLFIFDRICEWSSKCCTAVHGHFDFPSLCIPYICIL